MGYDLHACKSMYIYLFQERYNNSTSISISKVFFVWFCNVCPFHEREREREREREAGLDPYIIVAAPKEAQKRHGGKRKESTEASKNEVCCTIVQFLRCVYHSLPRETYTEA